MQILKSGKAKLINVPSGTQYKSVLSYCELMLEQTLLKAYIKLSSLGEKANQTSDMSWIWTAHVYQTWIQRTRMYRERIMSYLIEPVDAHLLHY